MNNIEGISGFLRSTSDRLIVSPRLALCCCSQVQHIKNKEPNLTSKDVSVKVIATLNGATIDLHSLKNCRSECKTIRRSAVV